MDVASRGQYDPGAIEHKWQNYWQKHQTFNTEDFDSRPKFYVLDMFPYPSGSGLHVGHVEGYTATDIVARFKRMQGYNVLHPMGWDAFGLPAEQYAIKTGQHPAETTRANVATYKQQIDRLGYSTDWRREINTTDAKYYRWTQWIFAQLYKKGLAYQSYEPVNWCPALGTVLANEEVVDGVSHVGGHPVEKKSIRQWVFKITEYAERLLEDLDDLDWPDSTKEMQRNWIGKSVGARVHFKVKGHDEHIITFTTRPDTLFGATFCVLAPENELVMKIVTDDRRSEVEAYVDEAQAASEFERTDAKRDKTGVWLGCYAINPVNGESIPVFVADYVLAKYGTGAVMAVPAHDHRDFEFAQKFELAIRPVIEAEGHDFQQGAYVGPGRYQGSDFIDDLDDQNQAIDRVCEWLETNECGHRDVTYRLRDWIFSRQRYWGEPFPLAFDDDNTVHLLGNLPVELPQTDDYKPTADGQPPLARCTEWLTFEEAGKTLTRETNIMPQWAGSCWYYLRYLDPDNATAFCDPRKEQHWLPVDLYVGGVEHANLHLLYARFWHKVLYDLGWVKSREPFQKVRHPGLILGENGEKMSKSRGNVVNPDDVIKEWGADALRLFEMFLGPFHQSKPWRTDGIVGLARFLKRVWRLIVAEDGTRVAAAPDGQASSAFTKTLHRTIKKVSEDTDDLQFNTAISAMMELVNLAYKEPALTDDHRKTLVLLLAPYAPHMAEELWEILGGKQSLAYEPWPEFDEEMTADDLVTLSIMIKGKLRGTIEVPLDQPEEQVVGMSKEVASVARALDGQTIRKVIYVPGKVVNFVI